MGSHQKNTTLQFMFKMIRIQVPTKEDIKIQLGPKCH